MVTGERIPVDRVARRHERDRFERITWARRVVRR
jgi:hypothetical protein